MKLEQFDEVDTFGPVTKLEKTVKTPGYSGEEATARNVVYKAGHYFRVSRISTLGWSVTEFNEDMRPIRRSASENMEYFDSEEDAHETARAWVEEHLNASE